MAWKYGKVIVSEWDYYILTKISFKKQQQLWHHSFGSSHESVLATALVSRTNDWLLAESVVCMASVCKCYGWSNITVDMAFCFCHPDRWVNITTIIILMLILIIIIRMMIMILMRIMIMLIIIMTTKIMIITIIMMIIIGPPRCRKWAPARAEFAERFPRRKLSNSPARGRAGHFRLNKRICASLVLFPCFLGTV